MRRRYSLRLRCCSLIAAGRPAAAAAQPPRRRHAAGDGRSIRAAPSFPAARVTLQPVDPPGAPQERSTDERGEAAFTNLPPGRYTVRGEFPGFEPRQIDDLRLRTGATRRELRLPIARHAEDVQVGQDGRERALDPRSGAFATVLSTRSDRRAAGRSRRDGGRLKEMAGPAP